MLLSMATHLRWCGKQTSFSCTLASGSCGSTTSASPQMSVASPICTRSSLMASPLLALLPEPAHRAAGAAQGGGAPGAYRREAGRGKAGPQCAAVRVRARTPGRGTADSSGQRLSAPGVGDYAPASHSRRRTAAQAERLSGCGYVGHRTCVPPVERRRRPCSTPPAVSAPCQPRRILGSRRTHTPRRAGAR